MEIDVVSLMLDRIWNLIQRSLHLNTSSVGLPAKESWNQVFQPKFGNNFNLLYAVVDNDLERVSVCYGSGKIFLFNNTR